GEDIVAAVPPQLLARQSRHRRPEPSADPNASIRHAQDSASKGRNVTGARTRMGYEGCGIVADDPNRGKAAHGEGPGQVGGTATGTSVADPGRLYRPGPANAC